MKKEKMTIWVMVLMIVGFGSCASGPPPGESIADLSLRNNGIYAGSKWISEQDYRKVYWFRIQPIVTGDFSVVISKYRKERVIEAEGVIEAFDNNNRRIARAKNRRLVFHAEAGNSYLFKVSRVFHDNGYFKITAFNAAQREEGRRLAEERAKEAKRRADEEKRLIEEEKRRVEEEKAEERRQAGLARYEQQQAEQNRLAELFRQAGQSQGNLRNTSWRYFYINTNKREKEEAIIDFGDGNYRLHVQREDEERIQVGMTYVVRPRTETRTFSGDFRVSGNTVIFRSDDGWYTFGTILGRTLEFGIDMAGNSRIFR